MEMPPIHMCAFLTHENERLKGKIADLKLHIAHLERTISNRNLDHARSCSISCQTDIAVQHRSSPPPPVKIVSDEYIRLHRLLTAQNELLKKYENEAIHNRQQRSSLSPPPSRLVDDRLLRCEKEKQQAERRASCAQRRAAKFEQRFERLRKELSVLDEGFFEEVEDLKYALQQATSLNREYEKTIQTLSARLGIAYPIPIDRRN